MNDEEIARLLSRSPEDLFGEKESELSKEQLPACIERTLDKYFKFLMNGKVLEEFAKAVFSVFFREVPQKVSEKLDTDFTTCLKQRKFILDALCKINDRDYLGVEMERSSGFHPDRFFMYWGVVISFQTQGIPTKDLRIPRCLMVVITRYPSIIEDDCWIERWRVRKDDPYKENSVCMDDSEATEKGSNLLLIDLSKFRRLVKTPTKGDFLQHFLALLIADTAEKSVRLYKSDTDGILNNAKERDFMYLGINWEEYMTEYKSVLAERQNAEEQIQKAREEGIAMGRAESAKELLAQTARADAEAKARAEAEARIAELEAKLAARS